MLIALALATVINTCDWSDRGKDRFMGDIPSAVDTYTDIPKPVRDRLKARMADPRAKLYDEITHMTRAGNAGEKNRYGLPTMMHFGNGSKLCATIDISRWADNDPGERGLVYCESEHCVVVWTVCRNVSKIARLGPVVPPRLLPPPAKLPPDPQPAEVTPLPVRVAAPIPPVFVPGVPDEPTTFSAEGNPDPMPRDSYPEPVSVRQEFFDPWSRPLFGPIARLFVPVDLPLQAPLVPLPLAQTPQTPMPPAPGVVPTVPSPFPLPPVIGTAILVPCSGVQLTLPATPAEIAALCPPSSAPNGAPVDLPERAADAVAPVPEMSTWALWALGGLGVWFMTRRRV